MRDAIILASVQKGKPHMNLAKELSQKITDPALNQNERAYLRCQLSKQFEGLGNYEGARGAMGEFWHRIGERPVLESLDQATSAEVLLRAGVLTGWIGSATQIVGAQDIAKDLISESITIFEILKTDLKVAEAQTDLAYCYWRQGAFDEARVILRQALSRLTETDSEQRAITLLRSAIVEKTASRHNDALRIYTEAAPLFEENNNHALSGRFHNGFANVLESLGRVEHRQDYIDRALIEYAAASFHFEQAGHTRYLACVENNLGFLFSTVGKFRDAHEHLDRAQALFTSLKDRAHIAQVDETRARVLLAEGRAADAEKLARSAVKILEGGGEQALLAEALTTHGITLARTNHYLPAQHALRRAVEVASQAGDFAGAGQSALVIIEEMGEQLTPAELSATYERAADLLATSRNPGVLSRLSTCARRVLFLIAALPAPSTWEGFSIKKAVHRYEACLIERALKETGGGVTRAAQLLGLKHHQNLTGLLNSRHKNLLHARTTILPRKRSIITTERCRSHRAPHDATNRASQGVTILYVEDNKMLINAVKDTLEAEGWSVETCEDGTAALSVTESKSHYDLLLFDNDLPGVSGLELVRRARQLRHRRHTPIIVFSASDCATESRCAGADAFLRKSEDILVITEVIARLLAGKSVRP